MLELLKSLINANSTHKHGELATAQILKNKLAQHGIGSQIDTWEQGRANLTVHLRAALPSCPALLFSSHLDVVPAGDQPWHYPPFEAREIDGRIFGRGSTDMKGGIAAVVEAICEVYASGTKLKGDLIFSANAGEETDSCGIKKFLDSYTLPIIAGVIVTEPTDMEVINCHRGIFWLKITTKGKTAHGSMPHLGINAIESMRKVLNSLVDFVPCEFSHPVLGQSTMSVNTISGGNAANVVPDQCSLTIDIRTLPGQSHIKIFADIQSMLESLTQMDKIFTAQLSIVRDCAAMETKADCDFVKRLCGIAGKTKPMPVQYTTDGPFFNSLDVPIVIFGPGDPQLCHKPDEYIEIDQLNLAKERYKQTILELLS